MKRLRRRTNIEALLCEKFEGAQTGFTTIRTSLCNNLDMVQQGFTMIELLIVFALIAGLVAIVVVSFPNNGKKAQDVQRKNDLKQYQTALLTFSNGNGGLYPISGTVNLTSLCETLEIGGCPDDPDSGQHYQYQSSLDGTQYAIWTTLESEETNWAACSAGMVGNAASAPSDGECPVEGVVATSTPTAGPTATSAPTATPTGAPLPTSSPTPSGPVNVNFAITASSDDVNQVNTSLINDVWVWLGNDSAGSASYAGLRFSNVTIPQGATVSQAYLQVRCKTGGWISMSFSMAADDVANSSTFTSSNKPGDRTLTSAKVNHSSNVSWTTNTWYQLDNISSVVQEVVDRGDWQSGNSLSIILRGTGSGYARKFVYAYDDSPVNAARLNVTYSY